MAAPQQQQGGGLSYIPEPYERPYFDGLFQAADTQRSGNIGGQQAVAFFSRSKLPVEQLKNVWTVADNPPSNSLDKRKFAVALRLIQLLQNGVKGQGPNLAAPPGTNLRPVYFEGVSGTSVPMPNQQQRQGPGSPPGGPQQPQQQQPPPQQQQPPPQQQQPPPQQQQQLPPQQQQQLPPQQQQGGRPPMTPQSQTPLRSATPTSMALTVQDPYTLTPSERARYEAIFPQYAKEDGYMHGKEAVELFSKSGLNHTQLRDIWNMVDTPVDNKLDKLEFAMAMHLIVCVSKKNLPLPSALPISLKQLKQQDHHDQQQQQQPPGSPQLQPSIQGSPSWGSQQQQQGMPSQMQPPPMQQQQFPQQQMQQEHQQQHPPPTRINAPSIESVMSGMTGPTTNMQGPPPIAQAGGVDISDAFEGLSTTSGADIASGLPPSTGFGTGFGDQQSYGGATERPSQGMGMAASSAASQGGEQPSIKADSEATPIASPPRMQESVSAQNQYTAQQPAPAPAPEPQKTSEALAKSYKMDDAHGELDKLKNVLQKLQAENISLKAQLGSMTDEEKDVQKKINATVHEISELSNRLTSLRAEVLESKTRLIEKTADLKAAHEKKGTLKDLIGEAEATKDAIESAYQGLEESIHAAQPAAPAPVPSYEADLFGFNAPAPAPASQAAASAPAPVPAPIPYNQNQQQGHQVETVEDDTSAVEHEDFEENPEQSEHQDEWTQQQNNYGQQGLGMGMGPQGSVFRNDQGSSNNDLYGSGLDEHFRAHAPSGHNKQSSISSQLSFDRDGIMGGAPIPAMGGAPIPAAHFASPSHETNHYEDHGAQNDGPNLKDVEDLKKRAKEAADIARDAESSLQKLMTTADELRTSADQAEMEARQKASQATEKKGGFMGGGKKKKSMKEADKAKQVAEEKKKAFLAAQSQANDAQHVAMETKREAEKLRKEAEQLEMDYASAASLKDRKHAPAPASQPSASNGGYPNHNQHAFQSYDQQQGYSQQQHQSYDQQQPQQHFGGNPSHGGFGGQPHGADGGYNPSVMGGGGGIEIPTPAAQGNDTYNNPFG